MAECIVEIDYRGQLIRCEDCKHYRQLEADMGECLLADSIFTCEVRFDDYCSRAECKTDDTVPTGFMSEWAREIEEQLNNLKIKKENKQ